MIIEGEEDDVGLLEELRNYLSDMEGACGGFDCQVAYQALGKL